MTKEQLFIQLVEKLDSQNLFFGHAVIDAEDEAMMVMMKVFAQTPDQILSSGDELITDKVAKKCSDIIEHRISSKKPMAYVVGQVNFAGLSFLCDERALVPRSPIAELIVNEFTDYFDITKIKRALDLCTGSGCIGIALAKYYQQIQVDISDISSESLLLASTNIKHLKVENQVVAFESDLFQDLSNSYDLIVSNPPYVSEEEYKELPEEYLQEPKLGLTTGMNGLRMPLQILINAPDFLNDEGYLVLEVGYTDELLNDSFPEVEFKWVEFAHGGQGVCVFSKQKLIEYQSIFKKFLKINN